MGRRIRDKAQQHSNTACRGDAVMELYHLTFPSHLCLHSADTTEQRRVGRLPVLFSLDPVCLSSPFSVTDKIAN